MITKIPLSAEVVEKLSTNGRRLPGMERLQPTKRLIDHLLWPMYTHWPASAYLIIAMAFFIIAMAFFALQIVGRMADSAVVWLCLLGGQIAITATGALSHRRLVRWEGWQLSKAYQDSLTKENNL